MGNFKKYMKMAIKYKKGCFYASNLKTEKRTIIFLIDFPQSWSVVSSIYEEACNRDDLQVHVIAVPQLKSGASESDIASIQNAAFDYLTELGVDSIKANTKDNTWIDVLSFKPEYIVYTRPYIEYYPEPYRPHNLYEHSKLIYIPYAYGMLGDKMLSLVLPDHFIYYMHRIYFANESRMHECINEQPWYKKGFAKRLLYKGFPRFDMLDSGVPEKSESEDDKYIVAWMPRWAANEDGKSQKTSHFLTYYKKFLEYVDNNDVSLIIRPHPLMFSSYISQGIMTSEEVDEFRKNCSERNIIIDEKKDCFETINSADVLVADYTSLIAEYFMTGKPVIFCDSVDGLNVEGQKICGRLYNADSFEDIEREISGLKSGKDEKLESRKDLINELLPNGVGNIGKDILDSLLNS